MSDFGVAEAMLLSSIIGGGAAVAGGALSNKQSQTTSPTMDPAYGPLQGQVLNMIRQRLSTPLDTSGYRGSGVANINRAYDLVGQNVTNSLTARGLNASPVAASSAATMQTGRAGDISQFQNSIPLLVDQLQRQNIGQAAGVLGLGRGVQTSSESGGGAAGAFTNLASYMGHLMRQRELAAQGALPNRGASGPLVQPGTFSPGTDYINAGYGGY